MSPQLDLKSQVQIFKKGGAVILQRYLRAHRGHALSEPFLVSVHRRSNMADLN
uniref:Uncharacterized protein n=1 Tax=Anguilla anguilla TaxID=7936 RepID=A0A0E9VBP1_ANGAN